MSARATTTPMPPSTRAVTPPPRGRAGGLAVTVPAGAGGGGSWMTWVFIRILASLERREAATIPPSPGRRKTARRWNGGRVSPRCVSRFPPAQDRRNSSTASTRRDSLGLEGSPSFEKMLDTYFSAARSVTTSVGDALVRSPGRHQLEHLALAGRQRGERVVAPAPGDEHG